MQPEPSRAFIQTSVIKTTMADIKRFHEDPGALARLTPPLVWMQVQRDDRSSLTAGEIEFTLWFGPLPIRWLARHEAGPTPDSFADAQLRGPLAYWRHEHIFEEVDGGIRLSDRISFAHNRGLRGLFTRLAFDGLPLRLLFLYRHWRTRRALNAG